MFQKKDIEAYQEVKAPVELKNRIRSSMEQQRRRIRKQQMTVLAAAACLAMIVSVGGMFDPSTIISVNDVAVSNRAVELETSGYYSLATANEGRSCEFQLSVPMEIQVTEETQICVSQGTLQMVETDMASEAITEMEISESTVIYWMVNGDTDSIPSCTITTGEKEYVYVIEFDEEKSVFTIKLEK